MSTPSLKIVVVEDDPSMRQALVRILNTDGMDLVAYESAEALLDAGTVPAADCFVIDISLPGLSGFQLYSRLIRVNGSVPVIFITASDAADVRDKAMQFGAAGFLPKPFMGRTLIDAIRRAVNVENEVQIST